MCDPTKLISGTITLAILILVVYVYWEEIFPIIHKFISKMRATLMWTMGSGNSAPVEKAQTVETESHQDVFELRFDHLAFGGTSILLIAAAIGLCWLCRCRNKRKQCRKQGQAACQCQQSTVTASQNPVQFPMQPMMSPMPPFPMPTPWYPWSYQPPTNSWGTPPFTAEPGRFSEIQEPSPTAQPPRRPPPPKSRELSPPTPRTATTEEPV